MAKESQPIRSQQKLSAATALDKFPNPGILKAHRKTPQRPTISGAFSFSSVFRA
jgi:hypothetical protein